eukprot:1159099-Pelagomonas_calceolata.AAC.7
MSPGARRHDQGKLVERDLKSNLENTLSPYELDMVMNSQHKVVKCCSVLAELALQAPINSIERQMLQHNVQVFYDTLGESRRSHQGMAQHGLSHVMCVDALFTSFSATGQSCVFDSKPKVENGDAA